MNELSQQSSPYLLQHANNPVHWKAWSAKNFELAQLQNKLIIISVGYSACHWCHVMEHETFENPEAAIVMNQHFINIKVDREEHPDVDAVYMKAVQIMTGRGGWPMNVVCLPNGKPVWGGTYFRKQEWMETLEELHQMYQNQTEKVLEYAEKLHNGIMQSSLIPKAEKIEELPSIEFLLEKWKKSFDHEFGGYARAPKFMMPNNLSFLLKYGHLKNDSEILDHVNLTLEKMAFGGLFDVLGGGFSRYSVDLKWHVPHFEKMLYDNAQLVSLYSEAYRLTKNNLYQEVVEKTLAFIDREFSHESGAFFSALDADSLNAENHLEEGAFYVWTKNELQELLASDFDLFAKIFNVNEFGHWENGNYVLIQNHSLEEIASREKIDLETLIAKKKYWEQKLFDARENRQKPRLDNKILTSWNAMMISGYLDAFKSFGNEKHLAKAKKAAQFVIDNLWHENGNLFHSYQNKTTAINGYTEDYCFVIEAFIKFYEVTFEENWLQKAKQLTDYCLDYFYEESSGFFLFASRSNDALIAPHFEIEDNVISASNSVMAVNLYKLSIYFENDYFLNLSKKMTYHVIPLINYPSAFANWLNAGMWFSEKSYELAICSDVAKNYSAKINQEYFPNLILSGTKNKISKLPFLKNKVETGKPQFYLCYQKTCEKPTESFAEILAQLREK